MKKYFIYGIIMSVCFLSVFSVPIQAVEPDEYEPDNTAGDAGIILLNDNTPQHHSFHFPEDEDWVKFYGIAGQIYEIEVTSVGADCDIAIRLYDSDGATLLEKTDDNSEGEGESLKKWVCSKSGIYYVRFSNNLTEGEKTDYEIRIFIPEAPSINGFIRGTVTDVSGVPVKDAKISTDAGTSGLSNGEGKFTIFQPVGTWSVTARADGYGSSSVDSVYVGNGETKLIDFRMEPDYPKGDIDASGATDLTDAILALQVIAVLYPGNTHLTGDVNHDGKIGLEEAVYILQIVSRIRD